MLSSKLLFDIIIPIQKSDLYPIFCDNRNLVDIRHDAVYIYSSHRLKRSKK
jgi:hypothetical protein